MDIWKPDSGITDFEVDPKGLAQEESWRIRSEWVSLKADLERTQELDTFSQKLSREWAIETGIIEDLYYIDRGVTTTLIEQGFLSSHMAHGSVNKDPEYILSLLNDQKAALDSLFAFVKSERKLSVSFIRELHALMTRSQETTDAFTPDGRKLQVPLLKGDWKMHPNHPSRDGVTFNYCPPEQVASEMDRLVSMHLEHEEAGIAPEVEAAWLHHRFSQIHPFQDGNGRIARALASLVLIKGGMFPLVIPREEKGLYLQSLKMADEGDLSPLVRTISRRQEVSLLRAQALQRL